MNITSPRTNERVDTGYTRKASLGKRHNLFVHQINSNVPFVQTPSDNLVCPICQELYNEPMMTIKCQHTFCKQCCETQRVSSRSAAKACPLCREVDVLDDLVPVPAIANLISDMRTYCDFSEFGCTETPTLGNRRTHMSACAYRTAFCTHKLRGCPWKGPNMKLDEHLGECLFETLRTYIQQTEERMRLLEETVQKQAAMLQALKGSGGTVVPKLERSESTTSATAGAEKTIGDGTTTDDTAADNSDAATLSLLDASLANAVSEASASDEESNRWNVDALECAQTLYGHRYAITSVAYMDGTIFSGSHDSSIRQWTIDFAASADANVLVSGENGAGVTGEYRCSAELKGHTATVWSLACDETRLYSGSADASIRVWNVASGKCERVIDGHESKVYALAVRGEYLFSAGADCEIYVWKVDDGSAVRTLSGHTDCIWSLSIRGDLLLSGGDDQSIRLWHIPTLAGVRTVTDEYGSKIVSVAAGYGYLCAGTDDCKIKVYNLQTLEFVTALSGHSWEVWQLEMAMGFLFSGSFDHTIKVWNLTDFSLITTLSGHTGYVHALRVVPEQRLVISGSGDKTVKLWHVRTNVTARTSAVTTDNEVVEQ